MNRVYLSLGSNIGTRENYLCNALKLFEEYSIRIAAISNVYETKPVGYLNQNNFLNIAVLIKTDYCPQDLLLIINLIEKRLGRKRTIRYGPRTIDIDILLFENQTIVTDELIIPHKEMLNRAFVLIPLAEIYHNSYDYNFIRLIDCCNDKNDVVLYKNFNSLFKV